MREHRLDELAQRCGARVIGDPAALVGPDVVIDTRKAGPGCLFVAIPGERVDGHDFAAQAAEAGAAAVLTNRELDVALPQLIVPDTVTGLAGLARSLAADEADRGLIVLAVTGSSGKTSTKDLIAHVLETAGPTVSPVGSFNNEIGVPLTATQVDESTRFLVSEMGARGQGHVARLCSITPPQIGLCLNVGRAHVGEFGSVEAIATAKSEIVRGLPDDGWAVLNADDDRVLAMADVTRARLALWSAQGRPEHAGAELAVWADDITATDTQQHAFMLSAARGDRVERAAVQLHVVGRHQVLNALAAATAALCAGLSLPAVAGALSSATNRSRWRMEVTTASDGLTVVNDSYNANPDSMRAALDTLAQMGEARRRTHPQAQTWAVLGDMLELGDDATAEHEAVGHHAAAAGIDHVVSVGELGRHISAGASGDGLTAVHVADRAALEAHVGVHVRPGDVVLIKASRGMALETVADALIAGADGRGAAQ